MIDKTLVESIGAKLLGKKQTIAVAESVTSGLLQLSLSAATDASKFYHGGITAFNLGQKYKYLNVDPIHAEQCNCVSESVAHQMAINVCKLFNSDWGVGITGYASPVPESGNQLFCFFAIANSNNIVAHARVDATTEKGLETQVYFATAALAKLLELIK